MLLHYQATKHLQCGELWTLANQSLYGSLLQAMQTLFMKPQVSGCGLVVHHMLRGEWRG